MAGRPQDRTHCPKGHEYTENNTLWRADRYGHPRKYRVCKACAKAIRDRWNAEHNPNKKQLLERMRMIGVELSEERAKVRSLQMELRAARVKIEDQNVRIAQLIENIGYRMAQEQLAREREDPYGASANH